MRNTSLVIACASFAFALAACGSEAPAPVVPHEAPLPADSSAKRTTDDADAAKMPAPLASATASSEAVVAPPPALPSVELVQVEPSAPPQKLPSIAILAPSKNQVIPTAKAKRTVVKLKVTGWDLAAGGNHVCISIDKHPCKRVTDLAAPLVLEDLDPTLDEGQHVLSVLARRGSNESVKPAGKGAAFASLSFFVGKRVPPVWKDGGPMLFLNVPDDGPAPADGVLIDAYGASFDLAKGYRIHASLSGPGLEGGTGESVTSFKPWRLKNARPGEYVVRFSLFHMEPALGPSDSSTTVAYESKPVQGPFAEVTRTFRVTAP